MSAFRPFRPHANGEGVDPRFEVVPSKADRTPPAAIDAEMACLGALLVEASVIDEILATIEEDDFYRDSHKKIFAAIKAVRSAGQPVNTITVGDELDRRGDSHDAGGTLAMGDCIAKLPGDGLDGMRYAAIVKDASDQRSLMELGADVLDGAYSRVTPGVLIETITRKLGEIQKRQLPPDEDESLFGHVAPSPMAPEAFYGVVGEIADLVDPLTEACREAVIGQFLVAFGNLIGKRAHWKIGTSRHWCNLFLCLVGASSMSRKGTSWDVTEWLVEKLDPDWARNRIMSGQSTGAGLINTIRDTEYDDDGREVERGVADKRVLFVETEFGGTLTLMSKDGNDLSSVVRQAWDGKRLMTRPKFRPLTATLPHVSIIGHITKEELQFRLGQSDRVNGYANRFLWLHSYRSKILPRGANFIEHLFEPVHRRLLDAHHFATEVIHQDVEFELDREAGEWWDPEGGLYAQLTQPKPGDYGQAIKRGAPIVLRLAVIYAILDSSRRIQMAHLKAALAFWNYCERTALCIFGGDKVDLEANRIVELLRKNPDGLKRNDINRELFHGHKKSEEFDALFGSLLHAGLITAVRKEGGAAGRPATYWKAV